MVRALVTLADLEIGRSATIRLLDVSGPASERLAELGFTPGTVVTPLRRAPLGGPTAYYIRGFTIGLREAEGRLVGVEPDVGAPRPVS